MLFYKHFVTIIFSIATLTVMGQTDQTYYPEDIGWANVVTDFGAVGDGVTDCTEAFRTAVTTQLNEYNSTIVVYIPDGVYLVSDSINFLSEFYSCCVTLQGQSKEGTVIKLLDSAPGFQDASAPRPIFRTRAGNQAFANYIFNLTIDTGNNNQGAVGIDYITSNTGSIRDVKINSPDGSGYCGIEMTRDWPGPGLLKNVEVSGFDFGILVATCEFSMTFENIILNNQNIAGIENTCNTISLRHVYSNNTVPAIRNFGRLILIDSDLDGGTSEAAIVNGSDNYIFLRNVNASGYEAIVEENSVLTGTDFIEEYHNKIDYSQFPNDGKSLGLEILETPDHLFNQSEDWANGTDYGAVVCNPNFSINDVTEEVQAALNSGSKCIYFTDFGDNSSGYYISSDVIIPPTVELITGFSLGSFNMVDDSHFVIQDGASTSLFIERLKGIKVRNQSDRTLVIRHVAGSEFSNTEANEGANYFLEDYVGDGFIMDYPVRLWGRHVNSEVQEEGAFNFRNNGGDLWLLGLKTEGRARIIETTKGGRTELLGGLVYPTSSFEGVDDIAFSTYNSCMSLVGVTMTSYITDGWYYHAFAETYEDTSYVLLSEEIWNNTPYEFSFYKTGDVECGVVSSVEEAHSIMYKIYPNPVNDELVTIETDFMEDAGHTRLMLRAIDGKLVKQLELVDFSIGSWSIDISGISAGVYILTLQTKDGMGHRKLIIE